MLRQPIVFRDFVKESQFGSFFIRLNHDKAK